MSECVFTHNHLETGQRKKQTHTKDDLDLCLFQMDREILRILKITTIEVKRHDCLGCSCLFSDGWEG